MIDSFVKKHVNLDGIDIKTQKKLLIFWGIIAIIVAIYCYIDSYDEEYINETLYPVAAADWLNNYIEENDIEDMHLYNGYNYGSYLLYQGIEVFIDSRAEQPYSPEFNENVTVFDDYAEVNYGSMSYMELFEKYDINYVLVYVDSIENTYLSEDEGAEELYSDEYFVIYYIVE